MTTETLTPTLADQIQKTFDDLDSEKTLINSCSRQWKSLSDHFASLSKNLDLHSETLDSKIQTVESETQQTLASFNLRETEIPNRELAISNSIESKKESAIKEMEDPESKSPSSKDIINELVKTGRELEAVCFACESGLIEKHAPTPLLKNYLQASKKKAALVVKNGNNSAAATEESINVELTAIRAIIKCVEYYKLESKFNTEGLKKRLSSIEKAKSDRKKTAATTKFHSKRARAIGGPSYRPPKAVRMANAAYTASFQPLPARHSYNYSMQGAGYDGSAPASYGSGHARSYSYSGYDYGASHSAAQQQYPH